MSYGVKARIGRSEPPIHFSPAAIRQISEFGASQSEIYDVVRTWLMDRFRRLRPSRRPYVFATNEYIVKMQGLHRRRWVREWVILSAAARDEFTVSVTALLEGTAKPGNPPADRHIPPSPREPMRRRIRASVFVADPSPGQTVRIQDAILQFLDELGFDVPEQGHE